MKALLIYSGGLDSTTLLYKYKQKIRLAVSLNVGSNHAAMEYKMAQYNCRKLGIPLIRLDLRGIFSFFKSGLLSGPEDIPEGHYESASMKKTVIPFRNGIFISIAAGIAESKGLDTILLGAHSGDHVIYPDCRDTFIRSMKKSLKQGMWKTVRLYAPFSGYNKREIALIGRKLGIDFSKTYSCYKGQKIHCGKCGTCIERKEALSGFDPTIYKK